MVMRCTCGNNHAIGKVVTKKPITASQRELKITTKQEAKLRTFKFIKKMENKVIDNSTGVPLSTIKFTLFLVFLMLLLALPKIFLSSQIYYTSKIVNDLAQDVAVLQSEQDMLKDNIELLKYKREVTDMINQN